MASNPLSRNGVLPLSQHVHDRDHRQGACWARREKATAGIGTCQERIAYGVKLHILTSASLDLYWQGADSWFMKVGIGKAAKELGVQLSLPTGTTRCKESGLGGVNCFLICKTNHDSRRSCRPNPAFAGCPWFLPACRARSRLDTHEEGRRAIGSRPAHLAASRLRTHAGPATSPTMGQPSDAGRKGIRPQGHPSLT